MAKAKTQYAPLPLHALGDARLSSLEIRLLASIAYHDRLSISRRQGAGCWAGNKTLADRCGCRLDSLSAAITKLVMCGYVIRSPHPINKRLRVYRVIFDEEDRATAQAFNQNDRASDQVLGADAADSAGTIGQPPYDDAATVGQAEQQSHEEKEELAVESIPPKRESILLKQESNSSKRLPPLHVGQWPGRNASGNPGATLAMIERALTDGGTLDANSAQIVLVISEGAEDNSPIQHQAARILETWGSARAA